MRNISLILLILAVGAGQGLAQRVNSLSAEANVVASADDNPQVAGLPGIDTRQDDFSFVFGFYPTITFNSIGAGNDFNLFYGFGLNRVESDLDLDSESHTFGTSWKGQLGSDWEIDLNQRFRKSPDFTTLNEFRGIVFTPEGVFFDFERVSQSRDSYDNSASLNLRYRFGARSSVSFGGGHSLRKFTESEFFLGRISDQQRFNGNIRYHNDLGSGTEWNIGYDFRQLDFEDFEDARNHAVTLGLQHELMQDLNLNISAGPSYVEATSTNEDFLGVDGSISLNKSIEDNVLSFGYQRRTAASSGIGSVSQTDSINFGFIRPIGRSTTLNIGVNGFRTRRQLDNPIDNEGVQVSAFGDFFLGQNLAVTLGASYRKQDSNDPIFDFSRSRFWVSLRLLLPEFWRSR